jgi:hypothetical protein
MNPLALLALGALAAGPDRIVQNGISPCVE